MLGNSELWTRIDAFQLDDPEATLSFSARLARENVWSLDYASRVIEEYKRFVYLAATSGQVIVPSDQVDQAWHQHLVYTRSYWDELCADVLGKPLHHGPTRGGQRELVRHEDLYDKTLQRYEEEFGESPPEDIWPTTHERFRQSSASVRVDRGRYWILPRITTRAVAPAACAGVAIFPAAGLLQMFLRLSGPEFLLFYGIGFAVSVALAVAIYLAMRGSAASDQSADQLADSLEPEQAAMLIGGRHRAIQSSLAELKSQDAIDMENARFIAKKSSVSSRSRLTRVLLDRISIEHNDTRYDDLVRAGRLEFARISSELESLQLTMPSQTVLARRAMQLLPFIVLLVIGAAKCVKGLQHERPVAFLVMAMIATTVAAIVTLLFGSRQTSLGGRVARALGQRYSSTNARAEDQLQDYPPGELAMWAAVGGLGVMPLLMGSDDLFYSNLISEGQSRAWADGGGYPGSIGSGCSAGDTGGCGSGCGSGCGGCGGCGA